MMLMVVVSFIEPKEYSMAAESSTRGIRVFSKGKLVPATEDVIHLAAGADVRSRQSTNDSTTAFTNHGSEIFELGTEAILLKKDGAAGTQEILDARVELS